MPRSSGRRKARKAGSRGAASQTVVLRRSDFKELSPLVLTIDDEDVEFVDYPAIAKAYAEAVAERRVIACEWIVLAGKRYLKMLEMAEEEGNDFYFSPEHVVDFCNFAEKMKHVEDGQWRYSQVGEDGMVDSSIILEPWQIWLFSAINGFRRSITGERLVKTALVIVPRKSGKSLIAAIAALFDLCCGGHLNPQVTVAAPTAKQADDTLFGDIVDMLKGDHELVEAYDIKVNKDEIKRGQGRIFKLSSIGERLDGLNPSLALFEEAHAGSAVVYNVVDSAFGARPDQMRFVISTAGYRPEGPAFDLMKDAESILGGGSKTGEWDFFAAIYTLDKSDYLDEQTNTIVWDNLFDDEKLVQKANPMYRISLDPLAIRSEMEKARRQASKRGEFARTRFNIWTGSGTSLVEPSAWAACRAKISLEDFVGQKCWIGVDLASQMDMCAIGLIFETPGDTLAVFAEYFMPEQSPTVIEPQVAAAIQAWSQLGGPLTLTDGGMADFDRIEESLLVYASVFDIQFINFDPYQSNQISYRLWQHNLPVAQYPNNQNTMSRPTDDLLTRIVAKRLIHDGNPVLAWNAENVHGERRGNGLILPRKDSQNSHRKIDGFVSLVMANGSRMDPGVVKQTKQEKIVIDPYRDRGLIGFDAKENQNGNDRYQTA